MINLVHRIVFKIYALSHKLWEYIIKNQRIAYWTAITEERISKLPPVCNKLTDKENKKLRIIISLM